MLDSIYHMTTALKSHLWRKDVIILSLCTQRCYGRHNADDLVIIADSLEECVRRLLIWKEAMEKKGLRVNAGKTKVMICGTGLDLLQSSGEYPCAVCRTGV